MNTGMNIEVAGCKSCPFHILEESGSAFCVHPDTLCDDGYIDEDIFYQYKHPDWCPLKKQSITITLKDNTKDSLK